MITFGLLISWTAVATAATLSPGPDTILVISHAANRGPRAGIAAALGIVVGGVWYMLLCGFGFLSLLNAEPALYFALRMFGACYLAWLGFRLLRASLTVTYSFNINSVATSSSPFRQGFLTNILNPKVAMFYLAVLPQFVGLGPHAPILGMVLIAIHYFTALMWFVLLALTVGRVGMRARKFTRCCEGVLGFAFLGLAGRLAFSK
jgi:threonine/homoserine/homoserine lactone efflux protein